MDKTNFALFVDLENVGGKASTLSHIIEKVKIRGNILIARVYGYTDAHAELKEMLLSNTFSVVPSIRWGKAQKNNLDIQLVIDALEVAYKNELIDCFCIVSGDSDYTPLVGKLKSLGKTVLGISRSEVASGIFISACNEFIFLESVTTKQPADQGKRRTEEASAFNSTDELVKLVETALTEQADEEGWIYASELKNIILRLRPEFNEKNFGYSSFGKLITHLQDKYATIRVETDHYSLMVRLAAEQKAAPQVTRENWVDTFRNVLKRYKDEGFDRVNPSVLKSAIQTEFPDFDERDIGCKRFSDVLKKLEKDGFLALEMNEQHDMLVRII